jgi:PII-like signaling protein
MNFETVTFVRIYLTEADGKLEALLRTLHDEAKVRGVTVFRAISGFGRNGVMHSSSLLDLTLDLPVTVEFFDRPERIAAILEKVDSRFAPGHIVRWQAEMNS